MDYTSNDMTLDQKQSPLKLPRGRQHRSGRDAEDSLHAKSFSARSNGSVKQLENPDACELKGASTQIAMKSVGTHHASPFVELMPDEGNGNDEKSGTNNIKVPELPVGAHEHKFGRKRQLSSRRFTRRSAREEESSPARSFDLGSSRSIENFMPHKKEARYGMQETVDNARNTGHSVRPEDKKKSEPHCAVAAAVQMDKMMLEDGK